MTLSTHRAVIISCGMILCSLAGCGGGIRMYSDTGEEVIRGEIVFDSLFAQPEPNDYTIGYGDVLDVVFLYDRDFSRDGLGVRPDGKISYPYIGEIDVVGMTVRQLDSLLTARFSEIILDPDITVIVKDFKPQLVYVMGEVSSAGGYPARSASTLLQALSQGRGPTMAGKKNGVLVIRRIAPDHIVGIEVDLNELLDEHRFDLDIALRPNDIVYVPKSRIARASDFADALFTVLSKPGDLYLRGWQIANVKALYEFYRATGQR